MFTCCRHCCPDSPHHPPGRDMHDHACGPAWCTESVAVETSDLTLW